MSDGPPTPAGWYPAPHANNEQRYWDGEKWLDWTPEQAAAAQAATSAPGAEPAAERAAPATLVNEAPQTTPKKGLRWWVWLLIALGAIIIIGGIIGAINGGGDDDEPASQSQEDPAVDDEPDEVPAEEEPAEEEPAPAPPAVEHQEFTGSGDDVVTVDISDPAIVWFSCPVCSSNTVLETDGNESLLVNTIGAYTGQKLINVNDGSLVTRFTVSADGAWTIKVDDISAAKQFGGAATGRGDSVILMSSEFEVATITNRGEGNFVVYSYGGDFSPLIVNEIGSYEGTVEMTGPAIVEVTSTGDWSITPE